jgi:hypothetical protein
MLAPIRHILPLTTITRERTLPHGGKVLVRKGTKVAATDVVAEGMVSAQHVLLDLARGLGVSMEQADRAIQRQAGDVVEAGDILAGPVGIARRVVRAPKAGKVVLIGNGQALLELHGRLFQLRAGYSGQVVDLIADRGVKIETTGGLIQGAWGNGRLDSGLLSLLAAAPDEVLDPNRLDVSMRGAVVMAGHVNSAEVLKAATEMTLRGIIIGSLSPDLLPLAAKTACPVIVLEGFGKMPISHSAFKLLSTSDRRETMVVADVWNPYTGSRPEVVISLPSASSQPPPREVVDFKAGQLVRNVRAPYPGGIGTLLNIMPGTTRLTSGVHARSGLVRLENGNNLVLPLANLEVLE